MKEILFLCHRIPYPPNKGDKIRAYHQLCALAEHHTVHLGTFVDDPDDWQGCETLDETCGRTCYQSLPSLRARIRSTMALVTNQPLGVLYYRDARLQQWVDRLMHERDINTVVVFSSTMAQYVKRYDRVRRILDFVDVDSEKWRQYAPTASIPMRWVYAHEGRQLLAAERKLAASFDASIFVSDAEAELFRERAPECADRITAVANGVDSAYFDPNRDYADPYGGQGAQTLVFTGAMNYRANVDAVVWFANEVLPLIQRQQPEIRFCIVGAKPAREVTDLAQRAGIEVTGTVDDVRPYLAHAAVSVAPLRIARGLQNKVLEALSMNKPVVLTPEAATGLKPLSPEFSAIESEPQALAGQIREFAESRPHVWASKPETEHQPDAGANTPRNYILKNYSWRSQLNQFLSLVEGNTSEQSVTPSKAEALAGGSA